jgi:membrane-bound lytic murein transglycosylase A
MPVPSCPAETVYPVALSIFRVITAAVAIVTLVAACAPTPEREDRLALEPVAFDDLVGWGEDSLAEVMPALRKSCAHFAQLPPDRPLGGEDLAATVGDLREPCQAAATLRGGDDQAARAYFEEWFLPFYVTNNGDGEGLFTGYFEVGLEGRRAADREYRVPLYRLPHDHVAIDLGDFDVALEGRNLVGRVENGRLKPYLARDRIDAGGLAGRGLELVWVRNTVDAFMLHVQGSGRITLPDGSVIRLGFAGHNGHDYRSIGRELIDQGELTLDQTSWQGIRSWVDNNPERAASLLSVNRRYIFFREIKGDGPIGAEGVALTEGRSLAVDTRFLPLGLPLWLDTKRPDNDARPLRRLMMAQDTGNAIRSPVRGDFFWGFGDAALALAGQMRSRGSYYLLLPRIVAGRLKTV